MTNAHTTRGLAILTVAAVPSELGNLPGLALGVGTTRAATTLARHLAQADPASVLLIGTAGAYASGPAIGTLVRVGRVGWGHSAVFASLGYVPVPVPPLDVAPSEDLADLPICDVLTVDAITTSPAVADHFGSTWQVEHMEAYAVAWACHEAGIPFQAVLGITNVVGPQAHAQWLNNHVAIEQAVRDAVHPLLTQVAPRHPPPGTRT